MNLHDANRLIEACNAQAKAAALLAVAWEEIAWSMAEDHAGASGARPAIPVQVGEPNPADYPSPQAVPQTSTNQAGVPEAPASAPAPVVEALVSLVELRTLLAELSQRGLTDQVRGLITGLGFDKLSEVPQEQYAVLFARAKELSHGS